MKDKHFEKWEVTRSRGKKHFILYAGVLGWGGFMFLFLTFVIPALKKARITFLESSSYFLVDFLVILIPAAILGFLGGKCMFYLIEKNYLKSMLWGLGLLLLLLPVYWVSEFEILTRQTFMLITANLLVWTVAGCLWAIWTWACSEKMYHKERAKREKEGGI